MDLGVHFQRVKMDRGSSLHSEMGPGVAFAIFLTFRGGGGHFQLRKVDRGGGRGSIFNWLKWTGGGPF